MSLNDGLSLLICGGASVLDAYDTCEMYDVPSAQWSRMAPMTTTRYGHAMVQVYGHLWIVAGMDVNDNDQRSVEIYDYAHNVTMPYGEILLEACSFFALVPY